MATRSRIAARTLSRAYDEALRPVDLKITQLAVLVAASLSDGRQTITDLADALGLERSSLSRNLDLLERRGLVALGPETQHRARHVSLTPEGRALLEAAMPLWEGAQARLHDRLGGAWDDTMAGLTLLAS
jgi:DNA-binding MarR family transcriptional regulator